MARSDDKVKAFLARLIEDDRPYLRIDATYVTVLQNGRIVSIVVIVAVGVKVTASAKFSAWILVRRSRPRELARRGQLASSWS